MQNFDRPNIIYGQVGKSIKQAPQQKFTTSPVLHVSRLNPYLVFSALTEMGTKLPWKK